MILLWGLADDQPLATVGDALARAGADVVFVDQCDALVTDVCIEASHVIVGKITSAGCEVDLASITAAYLRPYEFDRVPHRLPAGGWHLDRWHVENCDQLLWTWADLTTSMVLNRPAAMAGCCSKPHQYRMLRSSGFKVPATIVTTDPAAAREFCQSVGVAVYKSVSSIRSVVTKVGQSDLDRLDSVVWCPTQFQQYVPGVDYRVHVVEERLFAARIESDADDYRYSGRQGQSVSVEPAEIDADSLTRCKGLARRAGLALAGIDLRLTPDGEWYCFEINPSPAFTFYDRVPDSPIASAVAELLTAP